MFNEDLERINLIKSYKNADDTMQYTPEELAKIIGILPHKLEEARQSMKGIPFQMMADRVFYLKKDIIEWCENHPRFNGATYYCQN